MKYSEILSKIRKNTSFHLEFRSENHELWEKSLNDLDYINYYYTNEFLNFQKQLINDSSDEFFEISMMFFFENRFISLWPLSVTKINGVYKLSTFSFPVLYPVEARNINSKLKKKLFLETVNIIRDLDLETGEIKFFKPFLNSMKLNFWQENAVKYEKYFSNEYSLYVKIQDNYNEIFSNFRKGTKSSIKQAEKLWSTKVVSAEETELWDQFKQLHITVSSGKTRSDESWNIQYNNLINGKSFLVCLFEDNQKFIGGGLFSFSRDECEYSTAAYERLKFDKPLSHLVQQEAIKEMSKRNITWYRIGKKFIPNNKDIISDNKDYKISLFKEGFSTDLFQNSITSYSFNLTKI